MNGLLDIEEATGLAGGLVQDHGWVSINGVGCHIQRAKQINAPGQVFATDGDLGLIRTTEKEARRQGWEIAVCGVCGQTAVLVDALYPLETERNRCRDHLNR